MAKSLVKIQKKISKKKGNTTSLHEKSRDSYKLRRAAARAEKLKNQAARRVKLNEYYGILDINCLSQQLLTAISQQNCILPGSSTSS